MDTVYFTWTSWVLEVFSNVNLNCCFGRLSLFFIYWVLYPLVLISCSIFYYFQKVDFSLRIIFFLSLLF